MRDYVIRPAEKYDAKDIARFLSQLDHPTTAATVMDRWDGWASAGGVAWVAQLKSKEVVGLVTLNRMTVLHRDKLVGRITSLFVETHARGWGVGRALLVAAEAALAEQGCGLVELTSHSRFAKAHSFYEHLGYRKTSSRFAKPL